MKHPVCARCEAGPPEDFPPEVWATTPAAKFQELHRKAHELGRVLLDEAERVSTFLLRFLGLQK